jgi:hypothetical protein
MIFLLLPEVTKHGTKHGTFQRPPSCGLPLPPSFHFSLKVQIWMICFISFRCDFQFEFLKIYSYNFPWDEKND